MTDQTTKEKDMAGEQQSNYDTAMLYLSAADDEAPQVSDDEILLTVQFDLAAAQVRALLAVADELKALRGAVEGVGKAVDLLDSEHSSLRHMLGWVEDIAGKG